MSDNLRIPPGRSLDIYRLVVARGRQQTEVAYLFNVSPARVCQVVRRVRQWVDHSIGDWLFPRRDDLRFYVALESEQIRVQEFEHDLENVQITGPDWEYTRAVGANCQSDNTELSASANIDAHLSAKPINSAAPPPAVSLAVTPSGESDFLEPQVTELAHRLAQLLTVWKKSRNISSVIKSPSF